MKFPCPVIRRLVPPSAPRLSCTLPQLLSYQNHNPQRGGCQPLCANSRLQSTMSPAAASRTTVRGEE